MVDETPFWNVEREEKAFRLPKRKWRELLFIGAIARKGEFFVRDPSRPMPAFRDPDLFPEGASFRVKEEEDGTILIERVEDEA
jgi:hypothetical protein